jgi:hypothetical protein
MKHVSMTLEYKRSKAMSKYLNMTFLINLGWMDIPILFNTSLYFEVKYLWRIEANSALVAYP